MKESAAIIDVIPSLSRRRWAIAILPLATAFSVAVCGGGGYTDSSGNLNIGITVGEQFVSDTSVAQQ